MVKPGSAAIGRSSRTGRSAKSKNTKKRARDPEKEALIGKLSAALASAGYVVRREELKRGLGWKATSGSCRAFDQRLVFVDRRLSQEEQIAFLQQRIVTLGIEVRDEPPADHSTSPGASAPETPDAP